MFEKCTYLERSDPVASKISSGSLTSGFRPLPRWRRCRSHDEFGVAGEPNAHTVLTRRTRSVRNTKDELFNGNINDIIYEKNGVRRRTARKLKHTRPKSATTGEKQNSRRYQTYTIKFTIISIIIIIINATAHRR